MLPSKNHAPRSMFAGLRARERSAKRITLGEFEIFFEKGTQPLQVGIVVAKATVKKAVSRNRIKRLVKEALRDQLGAVTGKLLIIVKSDISMLKMGNVRERLTKILRKLDD